MKKNLKQLGRAGIMLTLVFALVLSVSPAFAALQAELAPTLALAFAENPANITGASYVHQANDATTAVFSSPSHEFPTGSDESFIGMSSGDASVMPTPGVEADISTEYDDAYNGVYDVTVLQIDLLAPTGTDCLQFDVAFFSMEYPDYVATQFNDAFIAELDVNDWSVSDTTITAPHNFALAPGDKILSINSGIEWSTALAAGTAFGIEDHGGTAMYTISTPTTDGAHSLFLTTWDMSDDALDSAVYLDRLRMFNSGGTCQSGVLPPPPFTIAPHSGPIVGGTTVVLTGSEFIGTTDVTFDGLSAAYTVDSDTQITATSPAHAAGAVDVSVTAPGGTTTVTNGYTYVAPVTAPEMAVYGLAVEIADGDVTPDVTDDTDFGGVAIAGGSNVNTFTITNTGDAVLELGTVAIEGSSDFTVTSQPVLSSVPVSGATAFTVEFDPSSAGLIEATVSIPNNDADESPYTFAVEGTGLTDVTAPTVTSIVRNGISPTSLQSVSYTVIFSEDVTGVDTPADLLVGASGPYGAIVTNIIGISGGDTYVVTVDTGVGNGTLWLEVLASSASIQDLAGNALVDDFTSGEEYYVVKSVSTLADFDGDGNDDIAVFRPSDGSWRIQGQGVYFYGEEGDIPVPADYNGDGKDDIAVFRPSNGTWYVRGQGSYNYGEVGDIPVPGDYNGDGTDDIAIFRASNHTWYVYGQGTYFYGNEGDIPVPADYDGNGTTDVAVFRGSNHTWYVYGQGTTVYGDTGDIPVPADYNGDGKADVAIWRPSTGNWHIYAAGVYNYGAVGDIPLMGDYDGNGNYDISVWRPLNGTWYIQGVGAFVYGASGDIPVEPEYLPKMEP